MSIQAIFRIAALLIAATTATLANAQDRNVRIHNDTGVTLYRFYSTKTDRSWSAPMSMSARLATITTANET